MKVGSPEYNALMKKWSDESFEEETQTQYEEYLEHKDNYKVNKEERE